MKFDLDDLNPGTWFEIDDAEVCVRICAGKDLDQIYKKTRKKRTEWKRNQRYEWEEIAFPEKEQKMINDFIIVDWKNICDANGVQLECNTANKNTLLRESPFFASFIANCIEKLNVDIANVREGEEKNSENG